MNEISTFLEKKASLRRFFNFIFQNIPCRRADETNFEGWTYKHLHQLTLETIQLDSKLEINWKFPASFQL
jgi:hypothetical protein